MRAGDGEPSLILSTGATDKVWDLVGSWGDEEASRPGDSYMGRSGGGGGNGPVWARF